MRKNMRPTWRRNGAVTNFSRFQNDADLNTFWFSAWGGETAADEFVRAYQKVIESRQRLRFDRVAQAKDLALIGMARDGRAWLLQARGPIVLVVQSATANRATELAEEAGGI